MSLKKNPQNTIAVKLHYVTNFQPNCAASIFKKKPKTKIKFRRESKIFCKNFLIFLILVRKLFENNGPKFFIKPTYVNTLNVLRAPYKNKISKHQLTLSRYFLIVKFDFECKDVFKFYNLNSLLYFINELKNFYSFFETNVCFQHKSILIFKFLYSDFFKIGTYV